MRILFLTYNIVGQSNYLRAESLARALARKGHEVTLVCAPGLAGAPDSTETETCERGSVHVVAIGSRGSSRYRNSGISMVDVLRRRFTLTHERFDLVHGFGHRPSVSWVGPAFARRQRIPYVADWCDLFGDGGIASERGVFSRLTLGAFDTWQESRTIRRAHAITVISSALEARARILAPGRPVVKVLPGGRPAPATPARDAVRNGQGIPEHAPVVVNVSQNHQDVELLYASIEAISATRDDVYFLLVGPPIPQIEALLDRHPLAARIRSTGQVPHREIPDYLAASDIAVLPYPPTTKNRCRFPCSFAEYLAAGLPVVTQATGDLPGLGAGDCGAMFVPAEPAAMAAAVDSLLESPQRSRAMRQNGLRVADSELSWEAGAEDLLTIYTQLASEHGSERIAVAT